MYPYFQKPSSLHAAENTVPDPIRDFLSQNPGFGTLIFQVTGGNGSFPVSGATVLLSKQLSGQNLSLSLRTDESGKTIPVSLPAPSRELSQSPGNGTAFSTYEAVISAPNYVSITVQDLPIFDGITTIQPVSLSPDFGQKPNGTEEIQDKEPDL